MKCQASSELLGLRDSYLRSELNSLVQPGGMDAATVLAADFKPSSICAGILEHDSCALLGRKFVPASMLFLGVEPAVLCVQRSQVLLMGSVVSFAALCTA